MNRADKFRRAAEWLEAYEPAPNEPDTAVFQEVADFLRRQAEHDERETFVRAAAKEYGRTPKEIRRAIRNRAAA